jgi:hypothetical protein
MATLKEVLNLGHCDAGEISGTNTDFCKIDIERLKALWRFPYNYKFDEGFNFNKENIQGLQQDGTLTKIYKFKTSAFTTEDNAVQTYAGGVKSLTDKLPIQIEGTLENGIQGYKQILSIEKAGYHSFILEDKDGTLFMATDKDGNPRPINSEFFQVKPYVGAGDNAANYMVEFQLDRKQFDNYISSLSSEDYDFDADDIVGVVDVDLQLIAPTNGGSVLNFNATRKTDKHTLKQAGLETLSVVVKVNGVVLAGTTAIGTTSDYVFTRTTGTFATGEVVSLEIPTAFVNDIPYKALAKTTIVL